MNPTEEELRLALNAQVTQLPVVHDPAGRAIGAAIRVRRRRALVAGCAAVVTVAVLVGGSLLARPDRPSAPAASPSVSAPPTDSALPPGGRPLDLVVGDRLQTASGALVDLPPQVDTVWRVDGGWLAWSFQQGTLIFLTPDGVRTELLRDVERFTMAPDHARFAWSTKTRMSVGRFAAGRVSEVRSTVHPTKAGPVLYSGTVVYVGGTQTGGGIDVQDLWTPAKGEYQESFDAITEATEVSEATPDGDLFLGMARKAGTDKGLCLALLNAHDALKPVRQNCAANAMAMRNNRISPDGRYAAVSSSEGGPGLSISFYRLDGLGEGVSRVAMCPVNAVQFGWEDNQSILAVDDRNVLHRCGIDGTSSVVAGPADPVRLVR